MFATLKNIWSDESGATAIEYGLIAALISIVAISAMQLTGDSLTSAFGLVSERLDEAVTSGEAEGGGGGGGNPPADPNG